MIPRGQRRFLFAYGVWVFVLLAYFVPGATWNPVSRFELTRSIVEHRALSIDGLEQSTGDRAFCAGHWYSDKAPIPSLLAVPAYAVVHVALLAAHRPIRFEARGPPSDPAARVVVNRAFRVALWACSVATAGLAGTLLAIAMFQVLRERTTATGALVCSATTVLATPIFAYATSFYGHTIAAALLFVAVAITTSPAPSRNLLRVAGACLGLAAGCEYLTAAPGLVVVAYAIFAWPRSRAEARGALFDLAIGAAVPIAVVAAYHTACFGAPWQTGYSHLVRRTFVRGHARGVMGIRTPSFVAIAGLLVGTRRGLFYLAPVAVLGAIGLVQGAGEEDRASRVASAAALVMLLLNAGYYMWWGGAAAGPRHLVPVMPMLGYGFARSWSRPTMRWLLPPLAVVSFAVMMSLVAVGLEAPEHGNVLTSYVWPHIVRGQIARMHGASNVGLLLGLHRTASLLPIVAWTIAGMAWLVRRTSPLWMQSRATPQCRRDPNP